MSRVSTTFGTRIIGQTEKALNSLLERLLTGTGVSEPQWVALTLAVNSDGAIGRDEFVARVAGSLHLSREDTVAMLSSLESSGLLATSGDETAPTTTGRNLHARIRTEVDGITDRLWGDMDKRDLETTGRVLGTILERANLELERH